MTDTAPKKLYEIHVWDTGLVTSFIRCESYLYQVYDAVTKEPLCAEGEFPEWFYNSDLAGINNCCVFVDKRSEWRQKIDTDGHFEIVSSFARPLTIHYVSNHPKPPSSESLLERFYPFFFTEGND